MGLPLYQPVKHTGVENEDTFLAHVVRRRPFFIERFRARTDPCRSPPATGGSATKWFAVRVGCIVPGCPACVSEPGRQSEEKRERVWRRCCRLERCRAARTDEWFAKS